MILGTVTNNKEVSDCTPFTNVVRLIKKFFVQSMPNVEPIGSTLLLQWTWQMKSGLPVDIVATVLLPLSSSCTPKLKWIINNCFWDCLVRCCWSSHDSTIFNGCGCCNANIPSNSHLQHLHLKYIFHCREQFFFVQNWWDQQQTQYSCRLSWMSEYCLRQPWLSLLCSNQELYTQHDTMLLIKRKNWLVANTAIFSKI